MSNISGLENEFEFVKYLNGKKVKELNPLMREVIDDIFNNIDEDSIVKCWRNHFKQKSDIFIKINKAIKRFLLIGNNSEYYIHGMICGEIDNFFWINKNDIEHIILEKRLKYSTSVHFGPLICQPKNRCLNYNPLYEKDRYCVQIKWYSLFDDVIENMNNKIKKFY